MNRDFFLLGVCVCVFQSELRHIRKKKNSEFREIKRVEYLSPVLYSISPKPYDCLQLKP